MTSQQGQQSRLGVGGREEPKAEHLSDSSGDGFKFFLFFLSFVLLRQGFSV